MKFPPFVVGVLLATALFEEMLDRISLLENGGPGPEVLLPGLMSSGQHLGVG